MCVSQINIRSLCLSSSVAMVSNRPVLVDHDAESACDLCLYSVCVAWQPHHREHE